MTQAPDAPEGGLPPAYLAKMKSYLTEVQASGKWSDFEFRLCPDLFRALGEDGARPTRLFGVRVREEDSWSWGWSLMVKVESGPGVSLWLPLPPPPKAPGESE